MSLFEKIVGKLKGRSQSPDDAVRANLYKHGDDGTKVRTVDHLAYFNTPSEADAYRDFVLQRGYTLEPRGEEYNEVAFTKDASVAGPEFDIKIQLLTLTAERLGGDYDGWGCVVVK